MTYIIENLRTFLAIGFPLLTAIAVLIRIQLCNKLGKLTKDLEKADSGVMQKIINIFGTQSKYKNALFSNKLAILEIYYSEQKMLGLSYDNLSHFTRNLPNLLVSLGLLGTFIGITLNLSNITDVISNDSGEASVVVANLQGPLESMAIAFYSSLYAIACAAGLTIANNIWNVELQKDKLLNLLESRLDNQITPNNDFDSRLKNVLSTVLYGSGKESESLENSIYQVLATILYSDPKENDDFNLESVLDKVFVKYFPDYVKTINSFVTSIDAFTDKVDVISDSSEKFVRSAGIFENASEQIDRYSQALYDWRNDFADTQTQFLKTTQHFSEKVDQLLKQNEEASTLAKEVYETFGRSTQSFENSTYRYQEVSQKIENSQFPTKLAEASQNLEQFSIAAKTLQTNIQGMENMAQTMQAAIETVQQLAQEVKSLNQHSNEIISLNHDRLIQEDNQLTKVERKINSSAQALQLVAEEIESYSRNIQQANTNLAAVSNTLSQLDNHTNEQLQSVSSLTNEVTTLQQKTNILIESHQIQQAEEVKQLSILSQNHKVLIRKVIEYQDNLNVEELTFNLAKEINQKMKNNIRSLAKVILDLSNQNQQTFQETLAILAEIKTQQQQTQNGIDNNVRDNNQQLQAINKTLAQLLAIAKQSQQQNHNLM
jgi:methyl-accepting chemotaxis protein